jgi:hypothetical protein
MKKYGWKPGRHPAISAQVVGQWLEALPDRRPDTILKASRAQKSPVHDWLWKLDESEAAREHRLLLVRLMLSALTTVNVVIYDRKKKARMIEYQSIVHSSREGDYDYMEDAMAEPDKRGFILAQALAELQAMKRRYAHLSELVVIFAAVDRVSKRHRKVA